MQANSKPFQKICENPDCKSKGVIILWNRELKLFINEYDGKPHRETCNYSITNRQDNKPTLQELSDQVFDLRERIDVSNTNMSKLIQVVTDPVNIELYKIIYRVYGYNRIYGMSFDPKKPDQPDHLDQESLAILTTHKQGAITIE